MAHQGGCICGAVRYAWGGPLCSASHCHCRSCQRAVGAGMVTFVGGALQDFALTKGEMAVFESSPGVRRGFCSACGTSLSYENQVGWPGEFHVTAASLDDPSGVRPTQHSFCEDRQSFLDYPKP